MTARNTLWYLVFSGFAVNYMIRINLNIAIVEMVKPKPLMNLTNFTSECIDSNLAPSHKNITGRRFQSEKFDWNEYDQGLVLGAFFWLHWITQIPGGLLAQKYGTKSVYGFSNFSGVLCCMLIPCTAYLGMKWLIFLRCIQGIFCGFAWPSMHNMTARWIPPNERSKFVTAYLGSSVGAAFTFPFCGFIIEYFGWELVFYATSILGTIWFIFWWTFVFDSPEMHPRISEKEKQFILDSLGQSVNRGKKPIPWKYILTSMPIWTNIIAQWGGVWGLFTLLTHAPTYFRFIHGWNIRMTGVLSGIPHVLRMLFALIFSHIGDYLLRSDKMSRTNVRKLATFFCTICQSFCMIALAFSGCNYTTAIVFMSLATAVNGAVSTGPLASLVDISPNYASITLGICNTIVAFVGFIVPLIVGLLTNNHQTMGRWQLVFLLAAFILFNSGMIFILFSKSELQSWNSFEKDSKHPETELMLIKTKKTAVVKN